MIADLISHQLTFSS